MNVSAQEDDRSDRRHQREHECVHNPTCVQEIEQVRCRWHLCRWDDAQFQHPTASLLLNRVPQLSRNRQPNTVECGRAYAHVPNPSRLLSPHDVKECLPAHAMQVMIRLCRSVQVVMLCPFPSAGITRIRFLGRWPRPPSQPADSCKLPVVVMEKVIGVAR